MTKSFKTYSTFMVVVWLLMGTGSSRIAAQTADDEIKAQISKLEKGQGEEVKSILPDLVAKYQNHPGILYLQGRVASDGVEAVKFYQSILDNFPKSEWADDALYRIYQYYYAMGLYRTAELKMQQLKKEYPASPYTSPGRVTATPKKEEAAVSIPSKEVTIVDTLPAPSLKSSGVMYPKNDQKESRGRYTLQVGAFSTVANAEKQKIFFEDLGYTVEITNKVRGGKSLYLVWVGSFTTQDEARGFGKEIKAKYKFDSMVVER